jgi:hypothetical protein
MAIKNSYSVIKFLDLSLRSDFFFAVYVQRLLIFSRGFLFIVTTCFGRSGHHQVYRF